MYSGRATMGFRGQLPNVPGAGGANELGEAYGKVRSVSWYWIGPIQSGRS